MKKMITLRSFIDEVDASIRRDLPARNLDAELKIALNGRDNRKDLVDLPGKTSVVCGAGMNSAEHVELSFATGARDVPAAEYFLAYQHRICDGVLKKIEIILGSDFARPIFPADVAALRQKLDTLLLELAQVSVPRAKPMAEYVPHPGMVSQGRHRVRTRILADFAYHDDSAFIRNEVARVRTIVSGLLDALAAKICTAA